MATNGNRGDLMKKLLILASLLLINPVAVFATESAITTTEPAITTTEPAITTTEPAINVTEPAVEVTEPAINVTEPAVEAPVVEEPNDWGTLIVTIFISAPLSVIGAYIVFKYDGKK